MWPNGRMDQDATWYAGRPWPRRHCVRWGLSLVIFQRGQPKGGIKYTLGGTNLQVADDRPYKTQQ